MLWFCIHFFKFLSLLIQWITIWILFTTFLGLGIKHLRSRWQILNDLILIADCIHSVDALLLCSLIPYINPCLTTPLPHRRWSTWLLLHPSALPNPSANPTPLIIASFLPRGFASGVATNKLQHSTCKMEALPRAAATSGMSGRWEGLCERGTGRVGEDKMTEERRECC